MASYNKIQLVGKLDKSPEVKATTNGVSLSKFTLIVPRLESLPNQKFDYIRITTWRDNADKSAAFSAGDVIFVDGRILVNSFEDETGQKKWTTDVEAKTVVNFTEVFEFAPSSDAAFPTQEAPSTNAAPSIENIEFTPVNDNTFFNESTTESNAAPETAEKPSVDEAPQQTTDATPQPTATEPQATEPIASETANTSENELEEEVPF
jgi:single stranded DNA-binding protein